MRLCCTLACYIYTVDVLVNYRLIGTFFYFIEENDDS